MRLPPPTASVWRRQLSPCLPLPPSIPLFVMAHSRFHNAEPPPPPHHRLPPCTASVCCRLRLRWLPPTAFIWLGSLPWPLFGLAPPPPFRPRSAVDYDFFLRILDLHNVRPAQPPLHRSCAGLPPSFAPAFPTAVGSPFLFSLLPVHAICVNFFRVSHRRRARCRATATPACPRRASASVCRRLLLGCPFPLR